MQFKTFIDVLGHSRLEIRFTKSCGKLADALVAYSLVSVFFFFSSGAVIFELFANGLNAINIGATVPGTDCRNDDTADFTFKPFKLFHYV